MKEVKLTKDLHRFSNNDRPYKDSIVEFLPISYLTTIVFEDDSRTFILPYLLKGAKCKVVSNLEHAVRVMFEKSQRLDIVSPDFLVTRELTKIAEEAFEVLESKCCRRN